MRLSHLLFFIIFNSTCLAQIYQSLDGMIEVLYYEGGDGTSVYLYNENTSYGYIALVQQ